MKERPASHPRPTFLHHRGEFTQPKEQVEPRLPEAIFPPGKPLPKDRLGFARWLVSKENPLTARVVANRHWAALFGTGIVKTIDDFGMQGALPTHPELLDWLAVEFMDNGWSLKHAPPHHRHQRRLPAELRRPRQLGQIPKPLLARAPRFRLEAEIIRDCALRSRRPPLRKNVRPAGPPAPARRRHRGRLRQPKWNPSTGEDRYRRSVYTYLKRTAALRHVHHLRRLRRGLPRPARRFQHPPPGPHPPERPDVRRDRRGIRQTHLGGARRRSLQDPARLPPRPHTPTKQCGNGQAREFHQEHQTGPPWPASCSTSTRRSPSLSRAPEKCGGRTSYLSAENPK